MMNSGAKTKPNHYHFFRVLAVLTLSAACLAAFIGGAAPAVAQADDTPFVNEPAIDLDEDPLTGKPWYETETPSEKLPEYSTSPATTPATTSSHSSATVSAVETEELSNAGGGTGGALLFALGAGVLLVVGGLLARRS